MFFLFDGTDEIGAVITGSPSRKGQSRENIFGAVDLHSRVTGPTNGLFGEFLANDDGVAGHTQHFAARQHWIKEMWQRLLAHDDVKRFVFERERFGTSDHSSNPE